jgi:hypothetical protein
MCDPEQRAEEHREYLAHKHRPSSMNCDQCTKLMPTQTIEQDWNGTGWNVCEFCIDNMPDFAAEYIDNLEREITQLGNI